MHDETPETNIAGQALERPESHYCLALREQNWPSDVKDMICHIAYGNVRSFTHLVISNPIRASLTKLKDASALESHTQRTLNNNYLENIVNQLGGEECRQKIDSLIQAQMGFYVSYPNLFQQQEARSAEIERAHSSIGLL